VAAVVVTMAVFMGGSSVFEWLCCVCSQTRLGHGPRHRGRQVQGVGKVAFRPAAGRRKRIPGAARSFFHRLARARSGAPQQVWFPCWARSARNCIGCCSCRRGVAGRWTAPLRFSLACLDFSFLFRGVQRGIFLFSEGAQRDHESRRIADLSRRTSLAESDFRLPITAK